LACHGQYLFMLGRTSEVSDLVNYLQDLIPKMKDLESIANAAIPLCSLLVSLGRSLDALQLFKIYVDLEESMNGNSFSSEVNVFYLYWFRLEHAADVKIAGGSAQTLEDVNEKEKCDVVRDILSKMHLRESRTSRAAIYSKLDELGASLEYVFARICFLLARSMISLSERSHIMTEEGMTATALLKTAIEYVNTRIFLYPLPESRLTFNWFQCRLLKAQVLETLATQIENVEESAVLTNQAREELDDCNAISERINCKLVIMMTACFFKNN
jgi:hypothetical protein